MAEQDEHGYIDKLINGDPAAAKPMGVINVKSNAKPECKKPSRRGFIATAVGAVAGLFGLAAGRRSRRC